MGLRLRGLQRLLAATLGTFLAAAPAAARASLEGDPPLAAYVADVDAYPQNFAIAQDAQSIVYVGNYDGVLIFDGERWELLRLPNRDIARTLTFDGAERVYVGGHNQLGYIQRDATGRERFHDLTPHAAALLKPGESFEDVWDILVAPQGVFFRALRHVFLYDPASNATRVWRHDGRFGGIVASEGRIVLQFRGEGLKQLVDGEWRLLPGSEPLDELCWQFLRLPDGGGLLALAADGRWRAWRDGRVVNVKVPASFPPSSSMSGGLVLADGSLVMVSGDGFIYSWNPRSGAARKFRLDTGYLNDVILDRGGGLLIAGEDRMLHLEWPAPWTALGETYGLTSSLTQVARWGERWIVLSSTGAFELEQVNGLPHFRPLDWTTAETWDFLPLDANTALLADSYDLQLIRNGRARALSNGALYPQVLRRALDDRDVVLVGLGPGIAVARRSGGDWTLTLTDHSQADLEVSTMVEAAPRELWLGSDRGGVWRLRFAPGYRAIDELRRFDAKDGIEYGEPAGGSVMRLANGRLYATTNQGVFRWDGERFAADDVGGLGAVREQGEWVDLLEAPDGALWAFSHKNVYRRGERGWSREDIVGVRQGAIEGATFDETGAPVFTTTRAIMRFDATAPAPPAEGAPAVLLRAVERRSPSGEVERLPLADALSLADGDFSLFLRFALPEFRRPNGSRYATRLAGLEPQASPWSATDTLQYPRLPPGRYQLEVAARDSLNRESQVVPVPLRIHPAWYASAMARGLWLVLALAGLGVLTLLAVRWRTSRLEGLVAARTSELRAANERLDAIAHRDGLTGVPNRRELDRHLDDTWAECLNDGTEMAVLAIDVDGFKRYNDEHGHQSGDEMLVRVVREVSACLDAGTDMLARYGGDEFFVVSCPASLAGARTLADALRKRVEAANLGATISIGVATRVPRTGGTVKDIVRGADAALYAAKSAGRNRVAA
jgi:diguanylate cyclase (GGDEF)-like protein